MKPFTRTLLGCTCVLLGGFAAAPLAAQGGMPDRAKELIENIRKEMEEIDRLLNQATNAASDAASGARSSGSSGASGESSSSTGGAASGVTETLKKTVQSQNQVIERIDELLRIAEEQSQNQSSGGQKQKQQQGEPQQGEEREPDNRMQEEPGMLPQGEQPEQSREKQPEDGENPDKERGEKRDAKNPPPDGATEELTGDPESGRWGTLPKYLQGIFRRGGRPEVPAKYRRFEREFYKRANEKRDR